METVEIRDESITLGQALKLHGVAENGALAKQLISTGEVKVNGDVETRRGRSLVPGDEVGVLGVTFAIAQAE
ncbi:RNA-binding S4 domain-containing protein [Brevibacterium ihuae]|uniref:RNA-binding S4 domain-containing protein n=1 Tax=Brevibacterium ihuae TaxID=1631743 RepID=UPI000C77FE6F|nr:RNA-binding S4 domain-containing protein [Brevibacterium ihuae]